ncbi:SDR family oxidoreductase [Streptomyces sp. NPDC091290]|uniref:SDR family oxidoreductase n=1 Tax=Streptomyces TaxID=1883 RepID=UPI000A3965DC|nr:SDR family oxidoreductase [Streptomyces viridochromogenes]
MTDFEGLTALVTGGASGIGRATADLLAERGARVAVLDLDPSAVDEPPLAYRADVTDDASVRTAVADAVSAAEVAGAIAYLASPLSGATTGTALAVDGGMQGPRLRQAAR